MSRLKQAEIAREMKCSAMTVSRQLAHPCAPQPGHDGRYDLGEVERWFAYRRQLSGNPDEGTRRRALRRYVETCLTYDMLHERIRPQDFQTKVRERMAFFERVETGTMVPTVNHG